MSIKLLTACIVMLGGAAVVDSAPTGPGSVSRVIPSSKDVNASIGVNAVDLQEALAARLAAHSDLSCSGCSVSTNKGVVIVDWTCEKDTEPDGPCIERAKSFHLVLTVLAATVSNSREYYTLYIVPDVTWNAVVVTGEGSSLKESSQSYTEWVKLTKFPKLAGKIYDIFTKSKKQLVLLDTPSASEQLSRAHDVLKKLKSPTCDTDALEQRFTSMDPKDESKSPERYATDAKYLFRDVTALADKCSQPAQSTPP